MQACKAYQSCYRSLKTAYKDNIEKETGKTATKSLSLLQFHCWEGRGVHPLRE